LFLSTLVEKVFSSSQIFCQLSSKNINKEIKIDILKKAASIKTED
jgi:hypothetical protein